MKIRVKVDLETDNSGDDDIIREIEGKAEYKELKKNQNICLDEGGVSTTITEQIEDIYVKIPARGSKQRAELVRQMLYKRFLTRDRVENDFRRETSELEVHRSLDLIASCYE